MSSERPSQTLADYVTLAISPALVMGLVGSLVFFLLEVLYQGQYEARLQWILFFFVFGAVLIARIAMLADIAERAGLYGLVLDLLVWLGMGYYVEYPADSPFRKLSWLINLGLVSLVWWCAHRLTWDCTHIDEESEAAGEGLLQAAGLQDREPGSRHPKEDDGKEKQQARAGGLAEWWERYQRYREEKLKRRTPGIWVVYFSLAALPLFGLGQSLIPVADVERRRYVFWLMGLYVGSGLGLLLTTCFLGLRRYLRQRRLQMPAAMTAMWLMSGGGLIVLLLALGALLPRPQAEYPLLGFRSAGIPERTKSNWGFEEGTSAKGSGSPNSDASADQQGPGEGTSSSGKGQSQGASGQGSSRTGQGSNGSASKTPGQGQSGQGAESAPGSNQGRQRDRTRPGSVSKGASSQESQRTQENGGRASGEAPGQQPSGGQTGQRGTGSGLMAAVRGLAAVLKWVVFGLLGLAVLFVLLRALLQFLANFTGWARSLLEALRGFWAALFGIWGQQKAEQEEEAETAERGPSERPFASFTNPFVDGSAGRWTVQELVRYTFAAFEAWARERGLGRQPDETPLELAERVGQEVPALEADVRQLTALYARAVYGRGGLPGNSTEVVRQFWDHLEAITEQPLSA